MQYLLMFLLFLLAVFLILLILVQRGRGGGLAGALGGMGGQSAFGTKAGDMFTKITIGLAAAWIVLCIVSIKLLGVSGERLNLGSTTQGEQQSQTGGSQGQGGTTESGTQAPSVPEGGEPAPSSPGTSPSPGPSPSRGTAPGSAPKS